MDSIINSVLTEQKLKGILLDVINYNLDIRNQYSNIVKIFLDTIGILKKNMVHANYDELIENLEKYRKLIIKSIKVIEIELSKFKSDSVTKLKKEKAMNYEKETVQKLLNSFINGINDITSQMILIDTYVKDWIKPNNSKLLLPANWEKLKNLYKEHMSYVDEILELLPQFDSSKLEEYWKEK